MPTLLGSLRRLALVPSLDEVSFQRRGFSVTESAATRRLEAVPQAVICGLEWGLEARDQWELERRLSMVEPELRGFAYEGATMASTFLDVMPGPRRHRTRDLLLGEGQPHLFLAYIGIGFAMSHLPRALWRKVVPDLTGSPYHPTMSWLAVDGYGFDKAYFHTREWVIEQRRPEPYPWHGDSRYFGRAFDQGIGRALWFIHGAVVEHVIGAVRAFDIDRQADLWSGVGLAATFAGGCSTDDLRALRRSAAEDRADFANHIAQGAVFAAKARSHAGYVPEHSRVAVSVFADMTVEAADALADETAVAESCGDQHPRYELWRSNIRTSFSRAAKTTYS